MYPTLKFLLMLCVVLLVASCSETGHNNDSEDDTDILFAPLNHDEQMDKSVVGFWAASSMPGSSRPGFFIFGEGEWLESADRPNLELLVVEFRPGNKWDAFLLLKDWNDEYYIDYPYMIGEYLFNENGQFMMSGGRFGCFSSVTGLYYVKGDYMVLRANRSSIRFKRYKPLSDPRVRRPVK